MSETYLLTHIYQLWETLVTMNTVVNDASGRASVIGPSADH